MRAPNSTASSWPPPSNASSWCVGTASSCAATCRRCQRRRAEEDGRGPDARDRRPAPGRPRARRRRAARRTEEIKRVVEPIGQKLGQMEGKVEQLERQRREADGRLGETLRSLHDGVGSLAAQAGNLTSALKRPSTRGSWGEIQLRNVIEMAGHGRALRLHRADHDPHRRRPTAPRRPRAPARRQARRHRLQGAARGVPHRAGSRR